MAKLARTLRKKFCTSYNERLNFQIRKYFKGNAWADMSVEPRDIKSEFLEMAKILKQASSSLDMLTVGHLQPAQKRVVNQRH